MCAHYSRSAIDNLCLTQRPAKASHQPGTFRFDFSVRQIGRWHYTIMQRKVGVTRVP